MHLFSVMQLLQCCASTALSVLQLDEMLRGAISSMCFCVQVARDLEE